MFDPWEAADSDASAMNTSEDGADEAATAAANTYWHKCIEVELWAARNAFIMLSCFMYFMT